VAKRNSRAFFLLSIFVGFTPYTNARYQITAVNLTETDREAGGKIHSESYE